MLYIIAFLAIALGVGFVGLVLARAAGRSTPVPPGIEPVEATEEDAVEETGPTARPGHLKLTI